MLNRRELIGALGATITAFSEPSVSAEQNGILLSTLLPKNSDFVPASKVEEEFRRIASSGKAVLLDYALHFSGAVNLPDNIRLLGVGEKPALIHDGAGPAILCAGPCFIDGITIDGGRKGTDRGRSQQCSLVALTSGGSGRTGRRVAGVKIGRLKIQNTDCLAALALANLESCEVESLVLEGCWGHGLLVFGLANSRIAKFHSKDIGNLGRSGTRLGSALAIFAERSPGKSPGSWYEPGTEAETDGIVFDDVYCADSTDSAVYIHGYPTGATVRNIKFGKVVIDGAGKDGFKVRYYAENVEAKAISIKDVSLRGVSVEDAKSVYLKSVEIINAGFDLAPRIGMRPAFNEKKSEYQSILEMPVGVLILNSSDVGIEDCKVHGVRRSPISKKYGFGLWIKNANSVKLRGEFSGIENKCVVLDAVRDADLTLSAGAEICPIVWFEGEAFSSKNVTLLIHSDVSKSSCIKKSDDVVNLKLAEFR